jgi:peptide/nickel transport system substrate-binding protein
MLPVNTLKIKLNSIKSFKIILILALSLIMLWALTPSAFGIKSGTLIFSKSKDALSLDPILALDWDSQEIVQQIFDPLIRFNPQSGKIEPALATSWDSFSGGRLWVFRLRKKVWFHDGTPFNARSVIFNFARINNLRDPGYWTNQALWNSLDTAAAPIISKIERLDDYTLKFTLKEPHVSFPRMLAHPVFSMVSPAAIEKWGPKFGSYPVGTGAFKFLDWRSGQRIIVENNRAYWDKPAYLNRIIFEVIPDDLSRMRQLERGNVDMIDNLDSGDLSRMKANPSLALMKNPRPNILFLSFNLNKSKLNREIRLGIASAINRKALINEFYPHRAEAAAMLLPDSYLQNLKPQGYAYNPQTAYRILGRSTREMRLNLLLCSENQPYIYQNRKLAERLKQYLKEAGVDLKISVVPYQVFQSRWAHGNFELALCGYSNITSPPDAYLAFLGRYLRFFPAAFHDFAPEIMTAQQNFYLPGRSSLYQKGLERAHVNVWFYPVMFNYHYLVRATRVKNLKADPNGFYDLRKCWIEE